MAAEATVGLLRVVLASNSAQFEAGMTSAGKTIDSFDKSARAAGQSLSRMVKDFDGTKVIGDANRIATAVEKIGGAAKLTEHETARVNAVVERALEKYQLLGQTAPQHLVDLANQTRKVEQETSRWHVAAKSLIALISIGAIARWGNEAIEAAGKLTDLSGKTGITTEGLQVLNFTLGQNGVSLDEAANAAVRMSRALVDGDKGVVGAVAKLGLNIQQLIASGPEQAFLEIGQAIASIPDPMQRASIATEIFGRTGADLLPAFTTNMKALGDEARTSGAILSDDLVRAGDRAGDSLTRLSSVGRALIANVLLPMAPGIEAIANLLANALTSGLQAARSGVESLLLKGLQLNLWLAETARGITEAVAAVPVLGKVFGQTSGDVDQFSKRAQHAKDTLAAFVREGNEPAKTSMATGTPVAANYADAVDKVERSTRRATTALRDAKIPQEQSNLLVSRSLIDTAKLTQQLEQWARVNGAVLAPSIRMVNAALEEQEPLVSTLQHQWVQFPGAVEQSTTEAGNGIFGFFQRVFGGAESLSQSISALFQQAFLGGSGALGAVQAFATQSLQALLGMIPHLGPFLSGFAGPIVAMLSKLAGKFKDFFRDIFGGPSAGELAGRQLVAGFESELAAGLNSQQIAEAAGEPWKQTVIAIRDAYIAMGRTQEEAMRDAERLWKASKDGPEAVARVIEEIRRKMRELASETPTVEVDVDTGEAQAAAAELTQQYDVQRASVESIKGEMADLAEEIKRVNSEGGDTEELNEQMKDLQAKLAAAEDEAERLRRAIEDIPTSHTIDIEYRYRNPPENTSGDGPANSGGPVDPGYAHGTMGRHGTWWKNFGRQSPRMLHGIEAVLRPRDVPRFMADMGPMLAGAGASSTVSNNYILVPMPQEAVGDPYRMTREVVRAMPGAIEINEGGIQTAIQRVYENARRGRG